MKRFRLSAFLTITALSVAGLVSHSAAQQGPPATRVSGRGHLNATPSISIQQGPCEQIMAACQ